MKLFVGKWKSYSSSGAEVRDFLHDGGASLQNSSPGLELFSRNDTLASADQDAETFIYRHTLSSSKLQLEKKQKGMQLSMRYWTRNSDASNP